MKKFLDDDFLLSCETSKELYFNACAKMPIIDYHCHISPMEIALDKKFSTITELWLSGDHYKWRMMRSDGIHEELITGNGNDFDKFEAFSSVMPKLFGNPIYHWCALELKRYFDIDSPLSKENCKEIYDKCNGKISADSLSARKIIEKSNVKVICTTDDPIDSLEYHKMIREDGSFKTKIFPAFRPDKALNIEKASFKEYIGKLGEVSGISISSVSDLEKALSSRLDFFEENLCRLSDISIEYPIFSPASLHEVDIIFKKALDSKELTIEETEKYKTYLLLFLGREYSKRSWVMQIHIGAIRDNSSRLYSSFGPDAGCDSAYTPHSIKNLSKYLDSLDKEDSLPKTILYSLNSSDYLALASLMGAFQKDEKGKIQLGSAWWFNDSKKGMEEQLSALANLGILGNFIGMLTDSRSFLSYTRHEYFRRILCDFIGRSVENGEYPYCDYLFEMVKNISYNNALEYFRF